MEANSEIQDFAQAWYFDELIQHVCPTYLVVFMFANELLFEKHLSHQLHDMLLFLQN